ncbi:MAG TPA: sigma 54-interacting transcriptional regulator [Bryobacteraceae bacterium]|nr:sigma 54-interacting transcriptional regulator [Bryobacteraceae bacterium]
MIAEPALDAVPEVLPGVVGSSEQMRAVAARVALIAESHLCCLVTGETGTGKELFARAIHDRSPRKQGPFVRVSCGVISDSEIEHASGGTLFLDEVDGLSATAQENLSRALQERESRPTGSDAPLVAAARIVAATNKNLYAFVEGGLFREDLFRRISVIGLHVPALRDHAMDIPALAEHFTRTYCARYGWRASGVDASAMERLTAYGWPGNVRELQEVLQRAAVFSTNTRLTARDLPLPDVPPPAALTLRAAKDHAIAQFERKYLADVLHRCHGNISRAAQIAGKERRTFQRLLRKYQLSGSAFRPCQS